MLTATILKYLLLLHLLLPQGPIFGGTSGGGSTIVHKYEVDSGNASADCGTSGNPCTQAFTPASGTTFLTLTDFWQEQQGTSLGTPTATDTASNTWAFDSSTQICNGTWCIEKAYANSTTTSATTVSVQWSLASGTNYAGYNGIIINGYSGVAASSPVDTQNTGMGTGTSLSSGSVTPAGNGELLEGDCGNESGGSQTWTGSGGSWITSANSGNAYFSEYWIQTTATAGTSAPTISTLAAWVCSIWTIKP